MDRTIFQAGKKQYTWYHVLSAAEFRGDAATVRDQIRDGLACQQYAEEEGFALDADALQAASDEFRYEHDLITAEEAERWLEERGLTQEDFNDYLARHLWRTRFASDLDRIRSEYHPSQEAVDSLIGSAALFGDLFQSLVWPLAWRVAAVMDAADAPDAETVAEELGRLYERAKITPADLEAWLERVQGTREWFDELVEMEAHYGQLCREALTPERYDRELHARRLPLTHVELEFGPFSSSDMAQEAYLCVTEDGEALKDVVERTGAELAQATWFLEDLPDDLRQLFLSASPGETLAPMEYDEGFWIYEVRRKIEPNLDDQEVKGRIEDRLLAAFSDALVEKHVRWIFCPE